MTNILKVEFLKTKHSVVRLLVWLLPVIAVLMMTAVFWDNQYLVQLMMGQWSYFWLNMSIGLLVGLSTYYQKQATKFREILTSPQDLMICSVIGVLLTSSWLMPFYSWLVRITNLYFALGIGFLGSILAMFLSRTTWSMWWPFDWGMLLNNLWIKGDFVLGSWSLLICGLILGIILSIFSAYSFKKQ